STVADTRGRFRFRFQADTSAVYLLSARYGGIEYFSSPVHTNPARPDTAIALLVYDTSSTAPISLEARHIVVPRPGEDGSRAVLDLIVLLNQGLRARVAADSLHASWSAPLPAASTGLEIGESDVSPDAVRRQNDSVLVTAPIAPGQKQLSLEYVIPKGHSTVEFPIGMGGGRLNVLVEENDTKVSGGTLALADSEVIEGRAFHRWTGEVPPGGSVRLTLSALPRTPVAVLTGLVAALGLVLALAAWRILQRGPPVPAPAPVPDTDPVLDAIAALDARYAGKESEIPAEEWQQYQAERARLKAELAASLAMRAGGR
ncbi:MAG: hypothetical protein ACJ8DJ_17085, partial [Gemmatimonadales bacterium]